MMMIWYSDSAEPTDCLLVPIRYAAETGFLGLKAYSTLKLVSWLWKPDVRENERINKCLKLFWQRTPNGTKELCSARAGLRVVNSEASSAQIDCKASLKLGFQRYDTSKPG